MLARVVLHFLNAYLYAIREKSMILDMVIDYAWKRFYGFIERREFI